MSHRRLTRGVGHIIAKAGAGPIRPLPTDGQVARYDGEWLVNEGGMVHNQRISQWDDVSPGVKHHVTEADIDFQPHVNANALNGLSVARFDMSRLDNGGFNTAQPATYLVVAAIEAALGRPQQIVDARGDGAAPPRHLLRIVSDESWQIYAGNGGVVGGTNDLQPHMFTAVFDGADSLLRIDGSDFLSGDAGLESRTGLTLGADHEQDLDIRNMEGIIAEVVIYDRRLTDAEILDAEENLNAKWFG